MNKNSEDPLDEDKSFNIITYLNNSVERRDFSEKKIERGRKHFHDRQGVGAKRTDLHRERTCGGSIKSIRIGELVAVLDPKIQLQKPKSCESPWSKTKTRLFLKEGLQMMAATSPQKSSTRSSSSKRKTTSSILPGYIPRRDLPQMIDRKSKGKYNLYNQSNQMYDTLR